jgi:solute carrier family 35 protein E1
VLVFAVSLTCCIFAMYQPVQFAVTQIVGFVILLPIMYATEGDMLQTFVEKLKTDSSLQFNLVMSGLCFYIYNELATYTLQVTGAVTASVANTAKRVVSILCRLLFFRHCA